MVYEKIDFSHLKIEGISDELMKNHLKLYQGYVDNTNKVVEKIQTLEKGSPEWAELKRRQGWEFNGMRLHELFFSNLGNQDFSMDSELRSLIIKEYGSMEKMFEFMKKTAMMRGIGWVVLFSDKGKLFFSWINEHDLGVMVGATPIVVLDVFEHSYMTHYGLDRASYVEAIIKAINWQVAEERLAKI